MIHLLTILVLLGAILLMVVGRVITIEGFIVCLTAFINLANLVIKDRFNVSISYLNSLFLYSIGLALFIS